ncbi:hypothetical protein [Guptibacillus hwajinpoensis]|uniref:ABC-type transport system involved in cytochrome bd biosynthesis fused ATPase/permease subunit n=1 Tax=Guptibacillus hwajinpoensis TaxID=208199 RepID=A0ABU0JVL6_9BACL|nr:hypothetical protein [Alkalihalobacillus hemicentroti]MDQ0481141.1 ABC-type transport system involved in cytochrome bd biosynthesis fused ATPase/permease subunit [Alkalihalobacillus hemicentroti]
MPKFATIFQVFGRKTVVWVTHYLVGMKRMDHIVFMDDGEIIIDGNHDELLMSSCYRRLYE